jgi:hypothetical protein
MPKPKIFLLANFPKDMPLADLEYFARKFREQTKKWLELDDYSVLGLVAPEGVTISGYAVPDEALQQLPELEVTVRQMHVDPAKAEHLEPLSKDFNRPWWGGKDVVGYLLRRGYGFMIDGSGLANHAGEMIPAQELVTVSVSVSAHSAEELAEELDKAAIPATVCGAAREDGLPCICQEMAEHLYIPHQPRWRPTESEPHHPDCPRYPLLEDGQLPSAGG